MDAVCSQKVGGGRGRLRHMQGIVPSIAIRYGLTVLDVTVNTRGDRPVRSFVERRVRSVDRSHQDPTRGLGVRRPRGRSGQWAVGLGRTVRQGAGMGLHGGHAGADGGRARARDGPAVARAAPRGAVHQLLLDVDRRIAEAWGATIARGRKAGVTVGVWDALFASTAEVQALTVVTRNVQDFVRLELGRNTAGDHKPWAGH